MQNDSTTRTHETLVNDVNKFKADASLLKDTAAQIKSDTVQIAQDVRSHAHAHVDEARQRVNDTVNAVCNTFTSHPIYVLGAVFTFGFLFGLRSRR